MEDIYIDVWKKLKSANALFIESTLMLHVFMYNDKKSDYDW